MQGYKVFHLQQNCLSRRLSKLVGVQLSEFKSAPGSSMNHSLSVLLFVEQLSISPSQTGRTTGMNTGITTRWQWQRSVDGSHQWLLPDPESNFSLSKQTCALTVPRNITVKAIMARVRLKMEEVTSLVIIKKTKWTRWRLLLGVNAVQVWLFIQLVTRPTWDKYTTSPLIAGSSKKHYTCNLVQRKTNKQTNTAFTLGQKSSSTSIRSSSISVLW